MAKGHDANIKHKQAYFLQCSKLDPALHLEVQSSAILHFKYLDLHSPTPFFKRIGQIFNSPQSPLEQNIYLQSNSSSTTLTNQLSTVPHSIQKYQTNYPVYPHPIFECFTPPNVSASVLSNPLLLLTYPLPTTFFLLNRLSIKSTPRMNPPALRIVYRQTPGFERNRILMKRVKEGCLNEFEVCGEALARTIVQKKNFQRKIGVVREYKRKDASKAYDPVPKCSSPLRYAVESDRGSDKIEYHLPQSISAHSIRSRRRSLHSKNTKYPVLNPVDEQLEESRERTGIWRALTSTFSKLLYTL